MAALPRNAGTSSPPASSTYVRSPASCGAPTSSTAPAGTVTGSHCGTGRPSTVTGAGAPVTHSVVGWLKRNAGPCKVHSSPGAPSALPTAALPSRKDRSSIGPQGGTPTCHRPVRAGQSCTVVMVPARTTSIRREPSVTPSRVAVLWVTASRSGWVRAARSSPRLVSMPSIRVAASAPASRASASARSAPRAITLASIGS